MNNKILIKLTFAKLDKSFDLFVPVNETIWQAKKLIIDAVQDICSFNLVESNYVLINVKTSKVYSNNEIIIDTDIRNATELIIIPVE